MIAVNLSKIFPATVKIQIKKLLRVIIRHYTHNVKMCLGIIPLKVSFEFLFLF